MTLTLFVALRTLKDVHILTRLELFTQPYCIKVTLSAEIWWYAGHY